MRWYAALIWIFMAILICVPTQIILRSLRLRIAKKFPQNFHRLVLQALGVRVFVHGSAWQQHQTLFVCNHCSWIDILALASVNKMRFIAKDDVRKWPVIGFLATLQDSVFVARNRPLRSVEQSNVIADALAAGDCVMLFPEGTTSDGNRILPFKSALLSAVEHTSYHIQPISLAYTHIHGMPMGRGYRSIAAWYANMELLPHLKSCIKWGVVDCHIHVHPPVSMQDFTSRKALSHYLQNTIQSGFYQLTHGRHAG